MEECSFQPFLEKYSRKQSDVEEFLVKNEMCMANLYAQQKLLSSHLQILQEQEDGMDRELQAKCEVSNDTGTNCQTPAPQGKEAVDGVSMEAERKKLTALHIERLQIVKDLCQLSSDFRGLKDHLLAHPSFHKAHRIVDFADGQLPSYTSRVKNKFLQLAASVHNFDETL
eukprot:Filipodium_phascolosomae@DN4908_c0_g1_i1.p1